MNKPQTLHELLRTVEDSALHHIRVSGVRNSSFTVQISIVENRLIGFVRHNMISITFFQVIKSIYYQWRRIINPSHAMMLKLLAYFCSETGIVYVYFTLSTYKRKFKSVKG